MLLNFNLHPRRCCACGQTLADAEQWVCATCATMLCKSRHIEHWQDNTRLAYLGRFEAMRHAASFTTYRRGGLTARVVRHLKYDRQPDLGLWMGRTAATVMRHCGAFDGVEMLLPLPLHPSRERQRGFNQAEAIAEGISQATGIRVRNDVLRRIRKSITQTLFVGEDRLRNIEDVFALNPNADINGRHVMLVDDVLTTGATLHSAIRALLAESTPSISIFTFAITE